MKIGIPQGLLYSKYHIFAETFFRELGAELVVSPGTNKAILEQGVRCCVDEACLPIKVFHGHVAWLKGRCDAILIPRLMGVREKEYICPMFCGLIELIKNDIPDLPPLLDTPLFSLDELAKWAMTAGRHITGDRDLIRAALAEALRRYDAQKPGLCQEDFPLTVGLLGHAYHVFDPFLNMNLVEKLNALGIGVLTAERLDRKLVSAETEKLFKKPFWTFAGEYYGAAVHLSGSKRVDGLIYLSSFSCGIDSVVTELIRQSVGDFPLLILKLDEQTGQAGMDTRVEAFADLLKRRRKHGNYLSQHGERGDGGGGPVSVPANSLYRTRTQS